MKTLRRTKAESSYALLSGKHVCLVEDDPEQVNILKAMFADCDCRLEVFTTGEAACGWLLRERVDLILLDVMMAGMDGWELHSRIRESGANTDTPLIFTTCVIDKNQEPLMTDLKAQTLSLAKPFDKAQLCKAIGRLLG